MNKGPKVFIFYYEWPSTAGNHCGMAYFFRCMREKDILPLELIRIPRRYVKWPYRLKRVWQKILIKYILFKINSKDIIFFTEYLGGKEPGDHAIFALDLRKFVHNPIIGLIHLPFQTLANLYDFSYMINSLEAVDHIIVFGNSLAKHLSRIGFNKKVVKTFYYVDTEFYKPENKNLHNDKFTVIVMGFLYRNRSLLLEIIKQCPMINFELCIGNHEELHQSFNKFKNVRMNKFIPENELLEKMQQADVSLSVFDDTIGSNVITTSLACGLPQVVSDVGSIRDYCSEKNAFFCNKVNDYVEAIKFLSANPERCKQMGINARKKAEEISLEKSTAWYKNFFMSLSE